MRRTITYALLITGAIFSASCKTNFVSSSYNTQNITISEETASTDSSIVKLISPYKIILEKDMNKVIAKSEEALVKNKPESNLTNFLADMLLEEAQKIVKDDNLNAKPAVSFFNYGGIRSALPEGEITVGNIFELMPFDNTLVMLELKGEQLQEFLNYIAYKKGGSVGGVKMTIKDNKAENILIAGKKIDVNAGYWIVTNDYVAGGGDGLKVLRNRVNYVNTNQKIRDLIISHMETKYMNGAPIKVKTDGRISYE